MLLVLPRQAKVPVTADTEACSRLARQLAGLSTAAVPQEEVPLQHKECLPLMCPQRVTNRGQSPCKIADLAPWQAGQVLPRQGVPWKDSL